MNVPRKRNQITALWVSLIVMAILLSCTDGLEDVDNPETGGDPYELTATLGERGIQLSWNAITDLEILGYNIYRSVDDSAFTKLDTNYVSTIYTDSSVRNGNAYDYYVVANTASGESDASQVARVRIHTYPVLIIGNESDTTTATRSVTLTFIAYGASEMILSNLESFEGAEWESFSLTKEWELTTGTGTKTVYGRVVWNNGDTSIVVNDSIRPAMLSPVLLIDDDVAETETRQVSLTISASGAIEMMISNEPFSSSVTSALIARKITEDQGVVPVLPKKKSDNSTNIQVSARKTSNTPRVTDKRFVDKDSEPAILSDEAQTSTETEWIPFSSTMSWELPTGAGTKTVYLKVRNDFLIEKETSDSIDPAVLLPSLTILPADSEYINHAEVTLSMPAVGATEMRISEIPDTHGVSWMNYQEVYLWNLGEDGAKTLYAWFANEFYTTEDPVQDQIKLDTQLELDSCCWSSSSGFDEVVIGDELTFYVRLSNDRIGPETGAVVTATVEGWAPLELVDQGDGSYECTKTISEEDPFILDSETLFNVLDRAENHDSTRYSDKKLTFGNHLFVKTYSADGWVVGEGVVQTENGDFVVLGKNERDFLLMKTNSVGVALWTTTFGGAENDNPHSIKQTNDGGYVLCGFTESYGAGGRDVWVVKTDADGTEQWNSTFGSTGTDEGHSIQQTSDGGYIVAGETNSYGTAVRSMWLVKTDASGTKVWDQLYAFGSYNYCEDGIQAVDGGFALAGYSGQNTTSINVIKTDASGVEEWSNTYLNESGCKSEATSIRQTDDGGFIITGRQIHYNSDLDQNESKILVIKTGASGIEEWRWVREEGGSRGNAVRQTEDGGFVVCGGGSSYAGSYDDFLLLDKLSFAGVLEWERTWTIHRLGELNSVELTGDGGYILAGYVREYVYSDSFLYVVLIRTDSQGRTD